MQEHPFAPYIRILARGKSNTRPLTLDEADAAMTMILTDQALPEQIGAFLMVLRYKEETPEEIAGFVRAARRLVKRPAGAPKIDLDWSCYAGKRRQLPWFALAALALSQTGVKIFMHGVEGHTAGRIYAEQTLRALGLPIAESLENAADILSKANLCYLPLAAVSPKLAELIDLKAVLGLRSPVHTIARLVNPFAADHVLQGIFHPGFNAVHQQAAALIEQPHLAVFRGEGGEIERRPQKPVDVLSVHNGILDTEIWPALMEEPRQAVDADMNMSRLASVWRGDATDEYATAAITGTLAIALKLLGKATTPADAQNKAAALWQSRDRAALRENI
ncbi:MAG: glycosyl transferase family protein [Rhodospirillales bacterium]|nr:glycosyl transferase family protein [Rhodospirillales bacterium]